MCNCTTWGALAADQGKTSTHTLSIPSEQRMRTYIPLVSPQIHLLGWVLHKSTKWLIPVTHDSMVPFELLVTLCPQCANGHHFLVVKAKRTTKNQTKICCFLGGKHASRGSTQGESISAMFWRVKNESPGPIHRNKQLPAPGAAPEVRRQGFWRPAARCPVIIK